MIPSEVHAWLTEADKGPVTGVSQVGGGCINNGACLTTSDGSRFFLKTNPDCPPDMFAREAEGLLALAVDGGPRLPEVFLVGKDFLLLEDLQPAAPVNGYWEEFGRRMAALHLKTASRFGFDHDNYIGSSPQVNPWMENGYTFFARHRLNSQAETALRHGLLSQADRDRVGALAALLPKLVPEQPASILHGDLWSGNWMTDSQAQPAIIDPAAYYGWAEADLAMMTLFGAPGPGFWEGYQEVRPLEPGYRQRFPLYNLYHLLNHLNLFGRSYLSQVTAVLERYR